MVGLASHDEPRTASASSGPWESVVEQGEQRTQLSLERANVDTSEDANVDTSAAANTDASSTAPTPGP